VAVQVLGENFQDPGHGSFSLPNGGRGRAGRGQNP
jgi:hypothetical protein